MCFTQGKFDSALNTFSRFSIFILFNLIGTFFSSSVSILNYIALASVYASPIKIKPDGNYAWLYALAKQAICAKYAASLFI